MTTLHNVCVSSRPEKPNPEAKVVELRSFARTAGDANGSRLEYPYSVKFASCGNAGENRNHLLLLAIVIIVFYAKRNVFRYKPASCVCSTSLQRTVKRGAVCMISTRFGGTHYEATSS
ncbi:hypothetical protein VTP01DRAFT_8481 [Rhizomucor pusillus]|uniref:uncharacterized protein n=1 Tax=Rhizomucor pusillus TaxID=4840 RepID=UPI003743BDED